MKKCLLFLLVISYHLGATQQAPSNKDRLLHVIEQEQKLRHDLETALIAYEDHKGNIGSIKSLLMRGAAVYPFFFTVGFRLNDLNLTRLGLEYDGEPNLRTMQHALTDGKFELASLLLTRIEQVHPHALFHHRRRSKAMPVELVQKLIAKGADPTAVKNGSVLSYNVSSPAVIEFLIMHGAAVNTPDADGHPPIFEAIDQNQPQTVKLLLQHRADPLAQDAQGHNAYWYAVHPALHRDRAVEEIQKIMRDYALEKGGEHLENNPLFK